jgi:monomeric sarcosine oxidase
VGTQEKFDIAVIGAGVFGGWTAWHLAKRGKKVVLLDAYGPANALASSGGESRIIRMGYGADELYTVWSQRSLEQWKKLFAALKLPFFHETGVLWLAGEDDSQLRRTATTLRHCKVRFEEFDRVTLEARYPQVSFEDVKKGIFEPGSGVLMARQAVAALVENAQRLGVEYRSAQVAKPTGSGRLEQIVTSQGERIDAEHFVFACGAWLGKVFPEVLGARIFPTRQEVFFFGIPGADMRFASPALPTWLFQEDLFYGMPDIESQGLKIAYDGHGEPVDPDTQSRVFTPVARERARAYLERRFPALKGAPILDTHVCQYENTSNGDFLIDRHPGMENVWFVGGGSGHGFKHGPAVGEYVTRRILDRAEPERRFSLATKATTQHRAVF